MVRQLRNGKIVDIGDIVATVNFSKWIRFKFDRNRNLYYVYVYIIS